MALTDNLISYWSLDGNSDDAVGSNHGTDQYITYSAGNGKIVQGAGFNGTTSKIVTSAITVPTNASISCWMKTTDPSNVASEHIYGFGSAGNAQFSFNVYNGTPRLQLVDSDNNYCLVNSGSALNNGNWHYLVGVKTGSGIEFFVDGTSQGTSSQTFTGNFNCTLEFGYNNGSYIYYQGALDESGYWSRALTSGEVTSLYGGGNGLAYPLTTGPTDYPATFTKGSFTLTGNDWTMGRALSAIFTLGQYALSILPIGVSIKSFIWKNKNTSTYTNKTKNTSSYTEKTKSSSSWTYKNKN